MTSTISADGRGRRRLIAVAFALTVILSLSASTGAPIGLADNATDAVTFILIDDDSIDNGNPPNFFSSADVNDDIADIGLRTQLRFFASNVGLSVVLHTGVVRNEGWFALESIPDSWDSAGPTADGLRNYVGRPSEQFPHSVGPGLGTADANGDRESLLDKIPGVTLLRTAGLQALTGKRVCAVVFDGNISMNYDPLNGSLKGANLGTVAFEVISVTPSTGSSTLALPEVEVQILDAEDVCEEDLERPPTNTNRAPVLGVVGDQAGDAGVLLTFTASASDPDVPADRLTFSLSGAPPGAEIDPDSGVFSWVPTEVQGPGVYELAVVVTDDGVPVLSDQETIRITVGETNSAPVVVGPGGRSNAEGDTVSLLVAASDADVPPNTLAWSVSGLPSGMSINPVTGEITGTVGFTAAAGSPYSVTVTVTDDGTPTLAGQATFTWTITNTNRAPKGLDVTLTVQAGVPTTLTLEGSDPDGGALTFSIESAPGQGSISGNMPTVVYLATLDATGVDTFTFRVSDGVPTSDAATVKIQILGYDPPDAAPDRYSVDRNETLAIGAPGVLSNDSAAIGSLTARLVAGATYGAVLLNPDGSFSYDHDGSGVPSDAFTYVAEDGIGSSGPITVTIDVDINRAPLAVDDFVSLDEDTAVAIEVLANDSDPDGDALEVASIGVATHGTLTAVGRGVYEYQPAQDWNGTEILTYTVSDGTGKFAKARIEIVVTPLNDAPLATDVNYRVSAGETVLIDLAAATFDADGDVLAFDLPFSRFEAETHWIEAGLLSFGAKIGVHGTVTMPYTVDDGNGGTSGATITVLVSGIRDDLGLPEFVNGSGAAETRGESNASAGFTFTGLSLVLGSLNQTFGLFRVPLLLFAITFGLSLMLGLGTKLSLFSGPVYLPLIGSQRIACILIPADGSLIARSAPGDSADVVHRFPAGQRDLTTTGRRAQLGSHLWAELETPDGDAWVNGRFLTLQVPFARFASDSRSQKLVEELRATIADDGSLAPITVPRGLYVAYHSSPLLTRAGELGTVLAGGTERLWWSRQGDRPSLVGSFKDVVAGPLAAAIDAYGARAGAEAAAEVPIELANLHSLAVGDPTAPGKDAWRVFFDYTGGETKIIALWKEADINAAAIEPRAVSRM